MVEVLATLTAIGKEGEKLDEVQVVSGCNECANVKDFADKHSEELAKYLFTRFSEEINGKCVSYGLLLEEVEKCEDEEEEENEEENGEEEERKTLVEYVKWL